MPLGQVRDAGLVSTVVLPAGATTTIGSAVNLNVSSRGQLIQNGEFLIEAPALLTAQLPDTKTITYDVIMSANPDLSSPVVVAPGVLQQLGAGGVGCAAATFRFRPASNGLQYWGLRATGIATVAASGSSAKMSFVF
jgi:hypothetical protein